jgi:hypothetical protein
MLAEGLAHAAEWYLQAAAERSPKERSPAIA